MTVSRTHRESSRDWSHVVGHTAGHSDHFWWEAITTLHYSCHILSVVLHFRFKSKFSICCSSYANSLSTSVLFKQPDYRLWNKLIRQTKPGLSRMIISAIRDSKGKNQINVHWKEINCKKTQGMKRQSRIPSSLILNSNSNNKSFPMLAFLYSRENNLEYTHTSPSHSLSLSLYIYIYIYTQSSKPQN